MSVLVSYVLLCFCCCFVVLPCFGDVQVQSAQLTVDASPASGRPISPTLFGLFFEEINHAGAGGLWAELVNNRGFEAGGPNTPSNIDPWSIIGTESSLIVSTDRSSCFERNKVALRMEVLCGTQGANICPSGGVGIYNPGFWGMNIEKGKAYNVTLYVRSTGAINVTVSLTSSDGLQTLATENLVASVSEVSNWKKFNLLLEAKATNRSSRLQLTTSTEGSIWFDQVSAMPVDTYKGHGFRKDLVDMLAAIKPQFLRFPGGCFVEGDWLRNAFRWKESIGPWEERPGHFGDVWMYWTDDGLGYLEFLQRRAKNARVNHLIFPADFYVIEMDEPLTKTCSILLGRPFMRTARTKIDVYAGTLSMEIEGQRKVGFNIYEVIRSV